MFIESHFSAQSHENTAFEVTFVAASLLFSKEFCIRVRASNNRAYRSKITYYQHMKWNCQKCWYQKKVASVFPAAGGALKRWWCAAPSLQVLIRHSPSIHLHHSNKEDLKHTHLHVPFQLFQLSLSFWGISWREERWFSGPECQRTCGSYQCPLVQSWHGPAPSGHCCGRSSSLWKEAGWTFQGHEELWITLC